MTQQPKSLAIGRPRQGTYGRLPLVMQVRTTFARGPRLHADLRERPADSGAAGEPSGAVLAGAAAG